MLGSDGKLYGTTSKELGTTANGYFSGTVFRFDPATSRFDSLKAFVPAKAAIAGIAAAGIYGRNRWGHWRKPGSRRINI